MVGYLLTTCERAVEVLALNIASPALLAVRLCVPTVSVEVLNDVLRLESGAVPRTVAPCLNVIDSPSAGVPPRDVTEAGERDGLLLVNCYFDIRKRPCNIVTWVVQELLGQTKFSVGDKSEQAVMPRTEPYNLDRSTLRD